MKRVDNKLHELTDDEHAEIEEALCEVRRGEFASEEEVVALFARYETWQRKLSRPFRPRR